MLGTFFGQPLVAGVVGLLLGIGMLLVSRASFRLMTPDRPEGLAIAGVLLFVRMGFAAAVLTAYHAFARSGFMAFAVTLTAGFFVTYWIELVRYAGLLRSRPRFVSRHG